VLQRGLARRAEWALGAVDDAASALLAAAVSAWETAGVTHCVVGGTVGCAVTELSAALDLKLRALGLPIRAHSTVAGPDAALLGASFIAAARTTVERST
jgi:hypothetical protein